LINPYQPPKADVADAVHPQQLPRTVRVLRALAIVGSVFIGLIPVLLLFASNPQGTASLVFSAIVLLLSGTSIVALVSRIAERPVFWSAMLLNGFALAFLLVAFYFGARRSNQEFALIVIIPVLLNMVAIDQLRRARAGRQPEVTRG
jgi:peptidoglycan/LPS O-acetylase OafA/YrhL